MTGAAVVPEHRPFKDAAAEFFKRLALRLLIIALLIQLSLAVSWAWTWMLYWNDQFSPVFICIAAVAGTALAAGLIMRVFLRDHNRILRWLSALVSSIVSLGCLAFITGARVGIIISVTPLAKTDWDGLAQLLLAGLVSWISLYAWVRPAQTPTAAPSLDEEPEPHLIAEIIPVEEEEPPVLAVQAESAGFRLPAWLHWPRQSGRAQPIQASPPSAIATQPEPAVRIRRPIRLIGAEEHRCPYCLELVEPDDPAGVEICPVCHAHHHRACWNVTGSCQVPHI